MPNTKGEQITIKDGEVEIHGFDSQAMSEFYQKMKSLVQIVSHKEYHEILQKRGGASVREFASYIARYGEIHGDDHITVIGHKLESPVIVIDKDAFPNEQFIQAAIQHELAELWVLFKMGFSLNGMVKADNLDVDGAIKLAHQYARKEEYQYAADNSFLNEYREWQKTVQLGNSTENDRIFEKVVQRYKRR